MLMSAITTHILDISSGRPAAGVTVTLEKSSGASGWEFIGQGETDDDGRLRDLTENYQLVPGDYRLNFDTGQYFAAQEIDAFYPQVTVVFTVRDAAQHQHVPLLLSPFG